MNTECGKNSFPGKSALVALKTCIQVTLYRLSRLYLGVHTYVITINFLKDHEFEKVMRAWGIQEDFEGEKERRKS